MGSWSTENKLQISLKSCKSSQSKDTMEIILQMKKKYIIFVKKIEIDIICIIYITAKIKK